MHKNARCCAYKEWKRPIGARSTSARDGSVEAEMQSFPLVHARVLNPALKEPVYRGSSHQMRYHPFPVAPQLPCRFRLRPPPHGKMINQARAYARSVTINTHMHLEQRASKRYSPTRKSFSQQDRHTGRRNHNKTRRLCMTCSLSGRIFNSSQFFSPSPESFLKFEYIFISYSYTLIYAYLVFKF
jgi:hypothetical protein